VIKIEASEDEDHVNSIKVIENEDLEVIDDVVVNDFEVCLKDFNKTQVYRSFAEKSDHSRELCNLGNIVVQEEALSTEGRRRSFIDGFKATEAGYISTSNHYLGNSNDYLDSGVYSGQVVLIGLICLEAEEFLVPNIDTLNRGYQSDLNMVGFYLNEDSFGSVLNNELFLIYNYDVFMNSDVFLIQFVLNEDAGFILCWKKLVFVISCLMFGENFEVSCEDSGCSGKFYFYFVLFRNWLKQELRFKKCRLIHSLMVNLVVISGQSGSSHFVFSTIQCRGMLKSCLLSINQRREFAGSAATTSSEDG
jgi:hypothetical protein